MSYPGDTRAFLVDLSVVQGLPDLARARDEGGLDGIIQKVTEGIGYTDPNALRNIELADKLKMLWLPYVFCRPSQKNGELEVERMWNTMPVAPAAVCVDLENHPNDWTPAEVVAYLVGFLRAVKKRTLARRLVYSYDYFFTHDLAGADAEEEIRDTTPWVAWPSWPKPGAPPHGSAPPLRKPWTGSMRWIWQYSADNSRIVSGTTVPGIPGVVDRNVFNGTLDELKAWLGLGRVIEPSPIVHPSVDFASRDPSSDDDGGPITNE